MDALNKKRMPVKICLIGDTSEMSPELLAMTRDALAGLEKYLNQDHSALEKQYREGKLSEMSGFDWYMDHDLNL